MIVDCAVVHLVVDIGQRRKREQGGRVRRSIPGPVDGERFAGYRSHVVDWSGERDGRMDHVERQLSATEVAVGVGGLGDDRDRAGFIEGRGQRRAGPQLGPRLVAPDHCGRQVGSVSGGRSGGQRELGADHHRRLGWLAAEGHGWAVTSESNRFFGVEC